MRVRRHRVSKNNQDEFYNWRDLNLGQNLAIYGTIYRICDCDQFTRVGLMFCLICQRMICVGMVGE